MMPELENNLKKLINFPTPAGVAAHIIALARDPDIEMGDVAKAVSLDPALTTKVLRIANSPLYAQRRKSENLRQALVVLGLNATLTLALSFTLVRSLKSNKGHGLDYPFYWRRVLIAATAARALGEALHQHAAEELFLAGLLQDVGMLALDSAVPDLYRTETALQHDHVAVAELERKRVKADHAEIGGWLMQTWNLPERLCHAISSSHRVDPRRASDPAEEFDRCVALSGHVADLFVLEEKSRPFTETAQAVERSTGIDRHVLGEVIGKVAALLPDAEKLFEIELNGAVQPDAIVEQAREILMLRNLHALREVNNLKASAALAQSRTLPAGDARMRDALTGVYTRAALEQHLQREFEHAKEHSWPLTLAIADLDNFRAINEAFGRQSGDRILEATAKILRGNTRDTDMTARYGGEEFALVFPATDAATGKIICARIVEAFQRARHDVGIATPTVTISLGCATFDSLAPFKSVAELLHAAESALQAAKLQGRNRTVRFDRAGPLPAA